MVSVLAMTMSETGECLKYKMIGNTSTEEIELWGHEYVCEASGQGGGERVQQPQRGGHRLRGQQDQVGGAAEEGCAIQKHGGHHFYLELPEESDNYDDLNEIMSNSSLNQHFLNLAR